MLAAAPPVPLFSLRSTTSRHDSLTSLIPEPEAFHETFPSLHRLIKTYLRSVPPRRTHCVHSDADGFIDWLYDNIEVTREQEEVLISLRLRQPTEYSLLQRQLAIIRFQLLVEKPGSRELLAARDPGARLHFNPCHVWAVLPAAEDGTPLRALLFPAQREVRTIAMDAATERWVRLLTTEEITIGEVLGRVDPGQRHALAELLQQLIVLGALAIDR
ncbi:hypothetical protein [Planctomicrobium sp. SH664]|uniref:hypothetical protein n=1 Tax=Planctomicrobium sp. SH664 TaxID=3448125 RepID=UPI003F5BD4EA